MDRRRANLSRGGCHAPIEPRSTILGRRRATQPLLVSPFGRHDSYESARRQPENQPARSDVTGPTRTSLILSDSYRLKYRDLDRRTPAE